MSIEMHPWAGDYAVGGGGGPAADGLHRQPEAAPRHRSVRLEQDGRVVARRGKHGPAALPARGDVCGILAT